MFSIREWRDRRRATRQRTNLSRGWLPVGIRVKALSEADYLVTGTVTYVGLTNPADGVFMFHLAEYPAEAFASDRIISPTRRGYTV